MFRKNYSSNDLHAFRGKLDSILIEIGAEKVEDMLEPAYSRLSEVFIRAREKVFLLHGREASFSSTIQ